MYKIFLDAFFQVMKYCRFHTKCLRPVKVCTTHASQILTRRGNNKKRDFIGTFHAIFMRKVYEGEIRVVGDYRLFRVVACQKYRRVRRASFILHFCLHHKIYSRRMMWIFKCLWAWAWKKGVFVIFLWIIWS